MNIDSIKPAHLSTDRGRFVGVQGTRRPKRSHELVAQNEQEINSSKVTVYNIEYNGNTCMAFGFELENKNSVFPVVTHGKEDKVETQVLPKEEPITFDETFLFQWGERKRSGDWRSLKSVAKPKKYLCVEETGKVSITEQEIPYFRIHYPDEEKDKSKITNQMRANTMPFRRRRLKRRRSCCKASVASHEPLLCNNRKTKRMKMPVKS